MKRKGIILITTGAILLLAAVALVVWNMIDNRQSEKRAQNALSAILEEIPEPHYTTVTTTTTYHEDLFEQYETTTTTVPEDDYITVDGTEYIGIIEVPSQGIQLPVIRNWSKSSLRIAPCRYVGCAKEGTLVIAGHNYTSHFGRLFSVHSGDLITFTDVNGLVYQYEIVYTDTIQGNDIESMLARDDGEWDLTLFTCTLGGQSRVTIRAVRIEDP